MQTTAVAYLHGPPKTWRGEPVLPELVDYLLAMSGDLQLRLSDYVVRERIPIPKMLRVDLAVALLRIDTAEARIFAEKLTGCAIQHCPSGLPPWPPKPVAPRHRGSRVVRVVGDNPCRPSTDAHRRFAQVKVGKSKDQLKALGVTQRDIERWTKKRWMEFGQ